MKRRNLIMNLQLFGVLNNPYTRRFMAPDTGDGTGGAGAEGNGEGSEEGEGSTEGEGTQTFDDVLKNKSFQSEFDKRVAKALDTAKGKWETDYQSKLETAKTEAQKLAKMNAEQKAQYEEQKKLDELTKREKDITTRELRATAYETLAEKNLPKELVDILNYSDAEQCNKSIESVEKAFQLAVEKAVNDKLRGGKPPQGGQGKVNSDSALRAAFGLK